MVTLRGQLLEAPGRAVLAPVRLAVIWLGEDERPVAQTNVVGVWSAPFPTKWEVSLATLPPPGALRRRADGSHDAKARVVSYLDTDANGELGLSTPERASTDIVTGTSEPWALWYFDGQLPETPSALQRGYNLVDDQTGVAPFSQFVPLGQTVAPDLRRYQCATAPCAELPRRTHLTGSVGVAGTKSAVVVRVEDEFGLLPDSALTVNDAVVKLNDATHRYELLQAAGPVVLAAFNTLVARTPGAVDETLVVAVPGSFAITAPAFAATVAPNAATDVKWSAAAGAAEYDVSLYDAAFAVRSHTTTSELSATVATSENGAMVLSVEARGPVAKSENGSYVMTYVGRSQPLTVAP